MLRAFVCLLLLLAGPAHAQSRYFPSTNRQSTFPTQTLPANTYTMGLGASNSAAQNQAIWNSVISSACATSGNAGAVIYLPTGQFPLQVPLSPITCLGLSIAGSGNQSTTLLLSGNGDGIWYQAPAGQVYGGFATVTNLRTFRSDSPTSGAALKLDHAANVTVSNVRLTGSFYDVECISCLNIFFADGAQADGLETQAGSALFMIHRSSSADRNNAAISISNAIVNTGAANSPFTYDHAIVVQNIDGMWIGSGHYAWSRGSDLFVQPQYSNDQIDNILSDPTAYFDTSGAGCVEFQPYGAVAAITALPQNSGDTTLTLTAAPATNVTGYSVLANGIPSGTTVSSGGGTSTVTLSGTVNSLGVAVGAAITFYPTYTGVNTAHSFHGICQAATGTAIIANDPALSGVRADMYILNAVGSAIDISAGKNFNFGGTVIDNPNTGATGANSVIVEGNAQHVNLSGMSFWGGTHAPTRHIVKRGQTNYLVASGNDYEASSATEDIQDISNGTTHTNIGPCTTDSTGNIASSGRGCPDIVVSGNGGGAWNATLQSKLASPLATWKGFVNNSNPAYFTFQDSGATTPILFGTGAATALDIRAEASVAGTINLGSVNNDTVNTGSAGTLGLNSVVLATDLNQSGTTTALPFASVGSVRAGQAVTGTSVQANTTVSSVAGTAQVVQSAAGGFPAGQFLIAFSSTAGFATGKTCVDNTSAGSIPGGASIVKVTANTSIGLSAALSSSGGSADSITCSVTQTAAAAFATGAQAIQMASVGSYVAGDTCTDTTASLSLGTISKVSTVGGVSWITLSTPATGSSSGASDSIKCSATQTANASFPTSTTNTIIPLASTAGYIAGMQCHDTTGAAVIGDGNLIASVQPNASITMTSGVSSNSSGAADSIKCDPVVTLSQATSGTINAGGSITFTNP